jgi:hypothetical protein
LRRGPRRALAHPLPPLGGEVALLLRQRRRVDLDHRGELVADDDLAVAVDDPPARRRDRQRAHAVGVRLGQVLLARQHLQVPQAEEDDREQRERDRAEDRYAQRELRRDGGPAIGDGLHHERESGDKPPVV